MFGELLLLEECHHVGEAEILTRFRHHERAGALPKSRVGNAHEGDRLHGRMAEQETFDLDDRDVLAAADDDVLGAAGNADVAVGIHPGEISGLEPAVFVMPV